MRGHPLGPSDRQWPSYHCWRLRTCHNTNRHPPTNQHASTAVQRGRRARGHVNCVKCQALLAVTQGPRACNATSSPHRIARACQPNQWSARQRPDMSQLRSRARPGNWPGHWPGHWPFRWQRSHEQPNARGRRIRYAGLDIGMLGPQGNASAGSLENRRRSSFFAWSVWGAPQGTFGAFAARRCR